MKSISDLHIRVCDKGLFLPVARRLAREVRKVSYWTFVDKSFPTMQERFGTGFEDIERVDCYLHDIEDVDCFMFPDIGLAGLQRELEEAGYPVWGARYGCELEQDRGKFLEMLEQTGLPVPVYEKVKGLSVLRKHLADKTDKWIKVSLWRGDWETFHWRSREEDQATLDGDAVAFGPNAEEIEFYVFDPIDAEVEDGCETHCIDGALPALVIHGMENKDKGYIGTFQPRAELPEQLGLVLDRVAPQLAEYGYRGGISIEVRITKDGTPYFTDITCRSGSPPSQVMCEMIDNWAEIAVQGALGHCVDPYPAAKFGVQAVVSVKPANEDWKTIKVDDELDRWLKVGCCMRRGNLLWMPRHLKHYGEEEMGWLTGIGDTLGEAIRHLQHNVKLLPDGASCAMDSLVGVLREIGEAEDQGMEFTEQPVPEPETAVEEPK